VRKNGEIEVKKVLPVHAEGHFVLSRASAVHNVAPARRGLASSTSTCPSHTCTLKDEKWKPPPGDRENDVPVMPGPVFPEIQHGPQERSLKLLPHLGCLQCDPGCHIEADAPVHAHAWR